MNKMIQNTKNYLDSQKKKYIFLITIILLGIITGIIFIFFIKNKDKSILEKEYDLIFKNIANNQLNYYETFINSITSNTLIIITTYILSISIIGMPIITLILFIKGFTLGFSISSLINIYNIKGILLSISYIFPSQIIKLIILLLISFHGISFSIKLFRYLFLKENIPLNKYFKNLNRIFIITILSIIICSILETFLSPLLIDLCL